MKLINCFSMFNGLTNEYKNRVRERYTGPHLYYTHGQGLYLEIYVKPFIARRDPLRVNVMVIEKKL